MKEKFKASAIHLSISALVLGIFYLFILNIWYPSPYFQVSGLLGIMLMLATIDLIIGPLLTFIVFKPKKSSLKFDLSVIAMIQLAALTYGALAIYQGHPVYIAYAVDRFTLVSVNEVDPQEAIYDKFKVSTFGKPIMVYAKSPEKSEKRNKLLFDSVEGKGDLENHAEYYEPIEKYTDKILERSIAVDKILAYPDSKEELESFLKQQGKKANEFAFLPLMGKSKVMLWVLDRKDAKPVAVLDIDPWELGKISSMQ
jgi:hypothetical protein